MTNEWKSVSFGALVEIRNGVNFTQASDGQSVRIVGVGDFQRKEELSNFSTASKIVINGDLQQDDLLADKDLLFVRSNGNRALVGRCVILKNVNEPITFSGFTIRARIKGSDISPRFLSQLVRSTLFHRHLHWFGSGSSINNLSQDALSDFTFMLPPLKEQNAISELIPGLGRGDREDVSRRRNQGQSLFLPGRNASGWTNHEAALKSQQVGKTPFRLHARAFQSKYGKHTQA